jgi:hypothetical protein
MPPYALQAASVDHPNYRNRPPEHIRHEEIAALSQLEHAINTAAVADNEHDAATAMRRSIESLCEIAKERRATGAQMGAAAPGGNSGSASEGERVGTGKAPAPRARIALDEEETDARIHQLTHAHLVAEGGLTNRGAVTQMLLNRSPEPQ